MPFGSKVKSLLWPAVKKYRLERDSLLHGNCLVLLYHRVIDLPTDPQLLAVTPDHFDSQLAYIKENHRVLSVEEFDHYLVGQQRFPRNSVFITFDDGYADNHVIARPILEKHGLQALFYVSSAYIGSGREYWWDEVERLILRNPALPPSFEFRVKDLVLEWNAKETIPMGALQEEYEALLITLRGMKSQERDDVLTDLRKRLGSPEARATHLPMTVDELRAFARSSSVVIGAHTRLHPSLARLDEDDQREEVFGSRADLEAMLDIPVTRFAYPFGTPSDFNDITIRSVEEAGFIHAAANNPGIAHARSPRFAFDRTLVRDWDVTEFRNELSKYVS